MWPFKRNRSAKPSDYNPLLKEIPTPHAFWSMADVRGANDCWDWRGPRTKQGDWALPPPLREGTDETRPHRIAYTLTRGPIAKAGPRRRYAVKQVCGNGNCVNPAHLALPEGAAHA